MNPNASPTLDHFLNLAQAGRTAPLDSDERQAFCLARSILNHAEALKDDEQALIGAGEFVKVAANCPVAMRWLIEGAQ